jgi:mRNA interferase MazF
MTCSHHDIVLLPIPFSDLSSHKVRPAVVIGFGTFPGEITSQLSSADFSLADWQAAGLNVPSGIKGQLCTVEERLVRRIVGTLAKADSTTLDNGLRRWLRL